MALNGFCSINRSFPENIPRKSPGATETNGDIERRFVEACLLPITLGLAYLVYVIVTMTLLNFAERDKRIGISK